MTRPRTTSWALTRRILGADRRVGAVVVIVALVAAALLAALPRAVATLADAVVVDRIAGTTSLVRDLEARPTEIGTGPAAAGTPVPQSLPAEWEPWFGQLAGGLATTRSALVPPVAGIVAEGRVQIVTGDVGIAAVPGHDVRFPKVKLVADPYIQEYATLTAGRWAAAMKQPPADRKSVV